MSPEVESFGMVFTSLRVQEDDLQRASIAFRRFDAMQQIRIEFYSVELAY